MRLLRRLDLFWYRQLSPTYHCLNWAFSSGEWPERLLRWARWWLEYHARGWAPPVPMCLECGAREPDPCKGHRYHMCCADDCDGNCACCCCAIGD